VTTPPADVRHASWLELFFDLVFVVAVANTDTGLVHHLNTAGLAVFIALMAVIWWAWVGVTFYLTRFPGEDGIQRLLILAAMFGSLIMAVGAPAVFRGASVEFALGYAAVRAALVAMYIRSAVVWPESRSISYFYTAWFSVGAIAWALSVFVPPPWRYVIWASAFAVELSAPAAARSLLARFPVDSSHLPERIGTFVIIVLGEAVVSVGAAAAGMVLGFTESVILATGFLIAAALWSSYFDAVEWGGRRSLERRRADGRLARDLYSYGHFPLVVGITATAAGVQWCVDHAHHESVIAGARAALAGGTAVTIAGMLGIQLGLRHGNRPHTFARCVAVAALVLIGLFLHGPAALFVGLCALVVVVDSVTHHRIRERRRPRIGEGQPTPESADFFSAPAAD
jgi:low temperature requirement protein LtrA